MSPYLDSRLVAIQIIPALSRVHGMHTRFLLIKVERFGTTFLADNLHVFFTNARVQQVANSDPVTIYWVWSRRLAEVGGHNDMIDGLV